MIFYDYYDAPDDAVEAFQAFSVDFTGVRIPPDYIRARCMPDQTNNFVTTFH